MVAPSQGIIAGAQNGTGVAASQITPAVPSVAGTNVSVNPNGAQTAPTAVSATPNSAAPINYGPIESASPGGNPSATPTTAPTIAPATTLSTGANQTVAGNLGNILGSNSSLMQQSRTTADQAMNSRGLLNSSMTAGAEEDAMVKNALPIAQQDANTYNANATLNTNTANTFKQNQFSADTSANAATSQQQNALIGQAMQNQTSVLDTKLQAQSSQATAALQAQTQQVIAQMNNQSAQVLAGINNANQVLLNTNTNAAQAYSQTMAAIGTIQANTTMDAATKQTLVNQQLAALQQAMTQFQAVGGTGNSAIGQLDLGSLWKTTPPASGATGTPLQQAVNPATSAAAPDTGTMAGIPPGMSIRDYINQQLQQQQFQVAPAGA